MVTTKIRKMKESDMESVMDQLLRLKRLNSEFDCTFSVSEDSRDEIEKYLKKIINDNDHVLLVAEVDGNVEGILMADILYRIYYEPKYEGRIREFYVMPEFRRHGIGKQLLDAFRKEVQPRGVMLITAEFPSLNVIASEFYKRIGYRELVKIYGQA
ncbi:MAG: GNAT family N-acetyltransferase [Thermoplasmata archaeon]